MKMRRYRPTRFAIPPAPLLSLKRFHIALQWIVAHLSKTTVEEGFSIRREFFELFWWPLLRGGRSSS